METRFARTEQTAQQLLSRLLDRQSPTFARDEEDDRTTVIDVANPLPWRRDDVVERLVVLQPYGYDLKNLRVVDDAGRPVPFRITERRFLERFWGIDYRTELWAEDQHRLLDDYLVPFGERFVGTEADRDRKDCFLSLQILARDLPAVGCARYHLVDQPGPVAENFSAVSARLEGAAAVLENDQVRVCLYPDGTFDLEHPASGHCWSGLGRLEDEADIGDEYDTCGAPEPGIISATDTGGSVRLVASSHLVAVAEASLVMDLPAEIAPDRRRRCPRTVPCTVRVKVRLEAGSRRVEVETVFDNAARDHRLQAVFPTGLHTDTVASDGHFQLQRRPLARTGGPAWAQPAPQGMAPAGLRLHRRRQGGPGGAQPRPARVQRPHVPRRQRRVPPDPAAGRGLAQPRRLPLPQQHQRRPDPGHPGGPVPGRAALPLRGGALHRRPPGRRHQGRERELAHAAGHPPGHGRPGPPRRPLPGGEEPAPRWRSPPSRRPSAGAPWWCAW